MSTAHQSIIPPAVLAEIRRMPVLNQDTESALAGRAARGCDTARDQLVESSLRFVCTVAWKYREYGVPLVDLVNEGVIGLMEAARRFDPDAGVRFSTYAIWWVRKRILDALREQAGPVRLPQSHKFLRRRLREAMGDLRRRLGREPEVDELAQRVAHSPLQIRRAARALVTAIPLEGGPESKPSLADTLPDAGQSPEKLAIRRDITRTVRAALMRLDVRRRAVLIHRYGLDGEKPRTLQQIGSRMGLSRERVRQIEVEACGRLRNLLAAPAART